MRVLFPTLLLAPALGGLASVIPLTSSSNVLDGLSQHQIKLSSSPTGTGETQTPSSGINDAPAGPPSLDRDEGYSENVDFKPSDLWKELAELEALKTKLPQLEEEITARARWLHKAADSLCASEVSSSLEPCSSGLWCATKKLLGLKKSKGGDTISERCIERSDSPGKEAKIEVPPWRQKVSHLAFDPAIEPLKTAVIESEFHTSPKGGSVLADMLQSGVLEFGFLLAGLALVGWCLWWVRPGSKGEGESSAIVAPLVASSRPSNHSRVFEWMQCCGGRPKTRGHHSGLEDPRPSSEKLAHFGESERRLEEGWVDGEADERFAVGNEEEEEEVFVREVIIQEGHVLSSPEEVDGRDPFPPWTSPRYQNEDAGHVIHGFTYTAGDAGIELPDSEEGSETEVGSGSISETGSVSEVDSLEGLTLGDEVASFREAFGLVEDMVAAFEQRKK